MGILSMATADIGDLSLLQSGSMTVSSTEARTGTYSFRQYQDQYGILTVPGAIDEGYVRVCVNIQGTALGAYPAWRLQLRESSEAHVYLEVDPWSGSATLYRRDSSSQAGTALATVIAGNWQEWDTWELYFLIADASGRLTLKCNGVVVIDFTGDTKSSQGATGTITNIKFGGESSYDYVWTGYGYFDDIIIRDDQWPYRGGLYVLKPNAGTTTEQWTPSVGNPEDCVDDLPPSFTDYISTDATVDGTQQLVNIESLPAASWNIRGVGVHVQHKATVSTDAFVHTLLLPGDVGASIAVGSDEGSETFALWAKTFYSVNPADSAAWADADIDALQIGVETQVQA